MIELRVRYARGAEVREDVKNQIDRGGLLVRVAATDDMQLGTAARLTLVMPDGTEIVSEGAILNLLGAHGVAVSVGPTVAADVRRAIAWRSGETDGVGDAIHEVVMPANAEPTPSGETQSDSVDAQAARAVPADGAAELLRLATLSHAEKVHLALHGSRDERNAILRDRNRGLHPFVLKNPQLNAEDVANIARNPQIAPDMLKLIAERKEWFQRPAIALALARNPKTPPDIAVRALDHISQESLRQIAKGSGALPHVVQAARKKVLAR